MASAEHGVRPVFIDAPSGRLVAMHYAPAEGLRGKMTALYVPPFAEEMNRSRRMAALQARAFASRGIGTLLLDLFGTGDSDGDFRDARLSLWLGDIVTAADWLERQGNPAPCLWGLRFGALLAYAAAANQPERFKRLLMWQPMTDGKAMLTQFLRVRVAASMTDGGAVEKTEELRAQLAKGQSIEVAGYELAAELAQALDDMRMGNLGLAAGASVRWFEVAAEASEQIMPAGQRVADGWRAAGVAVSVATVSGDPFWTLQETTLAPELLAATTCALEGCST